MLSVSTSGYAVFLGSRSNKRESTWWNYFPRCDYRLISSYNGDSWQNFIIKRQLAYVVAHFKCSDVSHLVCSPILTEVERKPVCVTMALKVIKRELFTYPLMFFLLPNRRTNPGSGCWNKQLEIKSKLVWPHNWMPRCNRNSNNAK